MTSRISGAIEYKVFWFLELVLGKPAFDVGCNLGKVTIPEIDRWALEPYFAQADCDQAVISL